jgi:hypothetical protein
MFALRNAASSPMFADRVRSNTNTSAAALVRATTDEAARHNIGDVTSRETAKLRKYFYTHVRDPIARLAP